MVKYEPNENTYKEMYLISKFEKDIMENSLQNLGTKKKNIDKNIIQSNKSILNHLKALWKTKGKRWFHHVKLKK